LHDDAIYIHREAGGVGIELDETPMFLTSKIKGAKYNTIRADNARPESISYCKRKGLNGIKAVDKWPNSVEDGITWMRAAKKIVIHPRCAEVQNEFRLYSYKIHKQTGDIMRDIVDKYNHYIDAIRYAFAPLIRNSARSFKDVI
jgi:phage terminase large subunit